MTTEPDQMREFLLTPVKLAHDNLALMDGTTAQLEKLIRESEVAFAVWWESEKDDELPEPGYLILKGACQMREASVASKAVTSKITAIPCEDREQAIDAKRLFGEPEYLN
jgi:hypothetical protein